jgi:hypothetical protein
MVTNRLEKRNFMQPMGRLNMHSKCLDIYIFSFKFWVGGGSENFFFFFPLRGKGEGENFI